MPTKISKKSNNETLTDQAAEQLASLFIKHAQYNRKKKESLKELETIPGVGKSIAVDLFDLGINSIAALKDRDPQSLYNRLCEIRSSKIDRCMLYVFRCAVYFASHKRHDPKKLDWWYWNDKENNIILK